MKSNSSLRVKTSLLAVAVSVALTANAQESQQQENQVEEERIEAITVTATKRSQVIYEVPIAMSAFNGEALASQGITDITDVGKFVPNLNITGFSAGHTSSANPFIRGIGLQDHLITTDPGVSVYVDGVYLGRQVGQNWNLNNIERIEVLRGPQGTLYGRNSIGGAINIITKQPNAEARTLLSAEAGTRGRLKGDVFVNRALNDEWSFNFNAGFNRRDGLGEFINVPNAKYDVGESEELHGRFAVRYAPSADFSLTLTADANDGEGGLRPYTVLIDEVPNGAYAQGERWDVPFPFGPLSNDDVAADIYDNATGTEEVTTVSNKASGVSLTAEWAWNADLSSKVIVSKRSSEYKAGLDDDGTIYALDHYPENGSADQTSIEFQLNGYMGGIDFVSGLYYFNEEGDNLQGEDSSFNGGPNLLSLNQEMTSKAVFINLGYDVTADLRLSGGVRYTMDEKNADADVGIGRVFASQDWNEFSFDLSANYTLENGLNLYGSIQSGYQSGQYPARPYCMFSEGPACFAASENVEAINYEIGLKGEVSADFSMSIALFNTEYSDLPYQLSVVGAGFGTDVYPVDQTSQGIEFESTAYFTDNFKLHSSFGYINVDVDQTAGIKPVAPLTPEWTVSLSPSYTFDMQSGAEVEVRVDYSFRDEMYGEPISNPERFTQLDARSLTNINVSYTPADEGYTVSLYGRNVFDERYDNARLNPGDYVLRILSNDASEFGVRFRTEF